jgi:hypothetical protein
MISAEPALSDARVRTNCAVLLSQGVTRACNVDGFCVVEEGVASSRFPGLTVRIAALQTPAHYAWVVDGPFPLGGVLERHRTSLGAELARGAVAIGELGPGIDAHWADYTLIPLAFDRELGMAVTSDLARRLRLDVERNDTAAVAAGLDAVGAPEGWGSRLAEIVSDTVRWRELAEAACREGIAAAGDHPDVPVIVHHTPGTYEICLEAAAELGPRLICAHSNFQAPDAATAVAHARALRERGARIDIMSGDAWGAREFHPTPEVTLALLGSGVVDLISTDYAGGFWDPMLLVVEKAAELGAITLERGVQMVTGAVADAVPLLAPQRGTIEPGKVADLVVTAPGSLSTVRQVFVSGIEVPRAQA